MTEPFGPLRRPGYLAPFEGQWVAVLDGAVVAHHESSQVMARQVMALGLAGRAVVEYVPRPGDPLFLGWVSL